MSGSNEWAAMDAYIAEHLIGDDTALDGALAANADAGLPPIDVSAAQGKLLHLLARLSGARRILEVGTLGGYSTIWLARALPADGKLVTLEIKASNAQVARHNIDAAGLGERVDIRVGPALDTLDRMIADVEAPFDLVFVDADKDNSLNYFKAALALSRPGTTLIFDNVVREGRVADLAADNSALQGIRALFAALKAESRVSATAVQTVGDKGWDGFLIAIVADAEA